MQTQALLAKAIDRSNLISELLSKARALTMLKDLQIFEWVTLEMNGYEDNVSQLPDYRKITAWHRTYYRPGRETIFGCARSFKNKRD